MFACLLGCLEIRLCVMQVIRPDLLQSGFELVQRENLEVTDDVSIIEALGQPVKLTKGSYTNLKVRLAGSCSMQSSSPAYA